MASTVYYPNCLAKFIVIFGFDEPSSLGHIVRVVPRSVQVTINSYRHPDSFEMEFDATTCPLSPDIMRGCFVEIYLFQMTGLGRVGWEYTDDPANILIAGIVDEPVLTADDRGKAFRISGQDYTTLLTAKQWNPKTPIARGRGLVETVQDIVDDAVHAAEHQGMTLNVTSLVDDPTITDVQRDIIERKTSVQRRGKNGPVVGAGHGATKDQGFAVPSGLNVWDVIVRLCEAHNYICYVEGQKIIIAQPHQLTTAELNRSARLIYGINLASLSISRSLVKKAVPQVRCQVYDSRRGVIVEGVYPPDNELVQKESRGVRGSRHAALRVTGKYTLTQEVELVLAPPGVTDQAALNEYCRVRYDARHQSEATFTWSTRSLKDIEGRDLLKIRYADPVALEWDDYSDATMQQMSPGERYRTLVRLGYAPEVAIVIADEYTRANFYRLPYYTTQVTYAFDREQGVTISGTAQKYIQSKVEKDAAAA